MLLVSGLDLLLVVFRTSIFVLHFGQNSGTLFIVELELI